MVLENDYLMRMILLFVQVLKQALGQRHKDPQQSAQELEAEIANAVNIDASLFFSLAPESMVTFLQLGDFDQRLAEYIVRAMALAADFLDTAEQPRTAELRRSQLNALVNAYSLDISESDLSYEAIDRFIQQAEQV